MKTRTDQRPGPIEQLLTVEGASQLLNIRPQTLAKWRMLGRGPAFVKIGGAVRYRPSAINAFIDANVGGVAAAAVA